MFTLEQINELHNRLGAMKTFAAYVAGLKELGIQQSVSYVADGHSSYLGADGYEVVSVPVHELLIVAEASDKAQFLQHLRLHEQGKTDYLTMSEGLAASGIEKWIIDTVHSTMNYYDKQGNLILTESII